MKWLNLALFIGLSVLWISSFFYGEGYDVIGTWAAMVVAGNITKDSFG